MASVPEYSEVIETNGVRVPFFPNVITPKIERPLRNNRYEGGECAALRQILRPGDRVLELGAGIGLISTVAALTEGVQSVTAVEANPELIPVIRETHRLNGVSRVDLRNGVVVPSNQKRTAFYLRADFWASSMEPDSRPYKKKKHLPCFNIRALVAEIRPTVIVCDIEGGEMGLFDDVDLSGVRAMILEMHPKVYGAETVENITGLIEGQGLGFQAPDKPSSVRYFERQEPAMPASAPAPAPAPAARPGKAAAVAPSALVINPDLSWMTDKPWKPRQARYLVTTCMKDEGPFILEWLAWHKSIGIQDFVVFSNDCTDGTDTLLDRLEEMGELRHLPNPAKIFDNPAFQPFALAYTPYLSEFKKADFYISMDVDEFINVRLGKGKIWELLEHTGPFDALSMSELNHGSNMRREYEPGLMTEQFPRHQRERPGKWRSRRGVKTIVRLGEKLKFIRNHRPDLRDDAGPVTWLDGSGRPIDHFHKDATENGMDIRGTYDLVALNHFALRSLNSYLVKMFRGDVVVKGKKVSHRYWRQRDRHSDLTINFDRQNTAFKRKYNAYMKDEKLRKIHEACCAAHQARIEELINTPTFKERRDWVIEHVWEPRAAEEQAAAAEEQAAKERGDNG